MRIWDGAELPFMLKCPMVALLTISADYCWLISNSSQGSNKSSLELTLEFISQDSLNIIRSWRSLHPMKIKYKIMFLVGELKKCQISKKLGTLTF